MINMTSAQIQMYVEGKTEDELEKVKEYEVKEFRKAFANGTNEAWEKYRRKVIKKVQRFNKIYGMNVDADLLMA